jgi:hypothetical protein
MKPFLSRRQALQEAALGFGGLALSSSAAWGAAPGEHTRCGRSSRILRPKAENVIFLYVGRGAERDRHVRPRSRCCGSSTASQAPFEIKGRALNGSQEVMASPWRSLRGRRRERTGDSNLLPHFQKVVDKVSFVRSMPTDRIDHSTAQFTFVTGRGFTGLSDAGGVGGLCAGDGDHQNLPGFVALGEGASIGSRAHSSAWLPPVYTGTAMRADGKAPIYDIKRPEDMAGEQQRRLLETVNALNREQKGGHALDQDLEARIANYELAARMQLEALRVADLSAESKATRDLYGVDEKVSGPYGKLCLMARRLVESGVRFVQVYGGGGGNWDTHSNIAGQLPGLCRVR